MPALRAYRVTKDDDPVGYLGEGGGPFVLASASALGFPFLRQARVTCLDAFHEDELARAAERAADLDQLVSALVQAGFQVEPAAYDELFAPLSEAPLAGPDADEELRHATQPAPAAERSAKR